MHSCIAHYVVCFCVAGGWLALWLQAMTALAQESAKHKQEQKEL